MHEQWRGAPHTPIFNTINLLIQTDDHILVRNKTGRYGNGLMALPEAFLDSRETIEVARGKFLKKIIDCDAYAYCQKIFDYPLRSLRGRYIAFVSSISMVDNSDIINGQCYWLPKEKLTELEDRFFEDNWLIVREMILV
jgi:hypothetical protein